jgi:hypothetical protein
MTALRILLGILLGAALAGGVFYFVLWNFDVDSDVALIVAMVAGAVGITYSAVAFGLNVYKLRFWSVVGYLLDMTWSILNTLGGLLVWIPACLIVGAKLLGRDDNTRRSGTFAYNKNPRDPSGAVYGATTIGTVIGGGWSTHEEIHVWQARMFGPAYFVIYGLSFILNVLFRLLTFRTSDLSEEAYYRVCFEEWAYWGGSTSSSDIKINWGGWIGGFILTSTYVTLVALIPIGLVTDTLGLWLIGSVGLALYNLVRALLPKGH